MKETEDITLLGLILHEAGTSAITMQQFRRCRTSTSSPTVVAANDASMIDFEFYDGSLYRVAARIKASVDATPGSGDMPGRIEFWVTKDGAASPPTDAVLVLKQNQCVGIGETTPSAAKLVITEGSTFAKPLLELNQTDQDEPFFSVVGTSAADTTKNISTAAIGTFTGRIRVEINGADYWIPYYAAT